MTLNFTQAAPRLASLFDDFLSRSFLIVFRLAQSMKTLLISCGFIAPAIYEIVKNSLKTAKNFKA
ncbi:hypothetical protein CI692_01140 [Escherichia coli]|nr:hypothetical protein CI692_01140 [Escherichia coli]